MPLTRRQALALAAAPLAAQSRPQIKVFDVLKYGAKGDGKTLDTAAIQRAIDAASAAGKHSQVLLRGKRRFLIGTLQLKGAIDFHLADDAELVVSTDPTHFVDKAVIAAREAHGLRITGTGKLNGRSREFMTGYDKNDEWWLPKQFRPKMFVLTACKGLEVRDITMADAPEWGLHMLGCEGVLVENFKVRNNLEVPNCDGIDPDHCRDVEIRKCDLVCGDDAIVIKATRQPVDYGPCANIRVSDCTIETQDSGLKIGTETVSEIHHVRFEGCRINKSSRGLTIQLRDEGDVHDIEFRDIEFSARYFSNPWWGRGEAISFTAIPRVAGGKTGALYNVRVANVTGRAENSVRVDGSRESRIHDIAFENVAITLERTTRYPGGLFDNRPTKVYPEIEPHGNPAFFVRRADRVWLRGCRVAWGANRPDYFTHALEAEDVTALDRSGFTGEAAHPERDKAVVQR